MNKGELSIDITPAEQASNSSQRSKEIAVNYQMVLAIWAID